jgi:hypothetical protein
MLQELMREIEKGGPLEVNHLAASLNTTPRMITMMLETLQKSGFLKQYETCGDGCAGCSLASACDHTNTTAGQIWQFGSETTKG